jgi:hypothetical protein
VTQRKIETILDQLERLGLGEDVEETADAQRPVERPDPLMSATLPRLVRSCTDTFLAPSMGSSTNFEGHWIASGLQIMREAKRTSRPCLISWIRSEMLSQITGSVLILNSSCDPPVKPASTGRTTEGHTRSGSRANCESLNLMVPSMSNR